MWMSEHYLALGGAEAWKCSRVPPLTRRHFNPQALIPFELAQALTWDHMFGRAQALSCAMLRGWEMKTFCQRLVRRPPPAIGSVIKSSYEHKWQKTNKKKTLAPSTIRPTLPRRWGKKINYIKQTYVILIPLKLWLTASINHSLIWALNLYMPYHREISLFLSSKGLWLFLSSPWAILHCPRIATQLSLCQTIISGFNSIFITPQSYFNYTCYHGVNTYCT